MHERKHLLIFEVYIHKYTYIYVACGLQKHECLANKEMQTLAKKFAIFYYITQGNIFLKRTTMKV